MASALFHSLATVQRTSGNVSNATRGRAMRRGAACMTGQVVTCFAAMGLMAGCGLNGAGTTGTAGSTVAAVTFQGHVHGGQQPVIGSTIQLYTVNTTTNAGASTALIASAVLTGAGGGFTITGDYSCTNATQVYITATGGSSGFGTNSSLSLMAALGACSALTPTTNIVINELSTVAAAYALAPYASDYLHIGSTTGNATGLANAFSTANLLVNVSAGAVVGAPQGVTLPVVELNTLANVLAACINTTGSSSAACTTLFGATGATETIGAALAIAKNPGASAITALYSLGSATAPFVPYLSAQPNDFTVAVKYTGTELLSPYGIAIDSTGNAWVTNEAGVSVVKAPALSAGFQTTTYTGGSLAGPRGISIDRTGNIWVANTGGNNVVKLNGAGVPISATNGFTTGGLSGPVAIANDSAGNAWVANLNGNSITELSNSGVGSTASPITGSNALSYPSSVAIDSTGRVLVGNNGSGQVCIFSNAAALQSCVSDGTLFGGTAIAVNSAGGVSLAGTTTGTALSGAFTLATNTGTVVTSSPGTGGGLVIPLAVAYDGSNNAWLAGSTSISKFSGLTAISPATGFGTVSSPEGIAIDDSGNVWTTNAGDNSISVFVGAATPVATPLSVNVGP